MSASASVTRCDRKSVSSASLESQGMVLLWLSNVLRRCALPLVLLVCFCCFLGCSSTRIHVDSDPQGAKVLLDGAWCGRVTPCEIPVGQIPAGLHRVSVEKQGYELVSDVQSLRVSASAVAIVGSALHPAVLIQEATGDHWKSFSGWDGKTFRLVKKPPR